MPDMALVIKHRMQVVVDLQQCRRPGEAFMNYELAGQLIAKTVKELMNAQAAISPEKRLSCLLALDETHMWAPQNPPSYLATSTAKDLLDTLTIVATRGRKHGVVPFFAAQRIAKVHKDVIGGCETRILGKTDLDNDIARYREYVSREVISDQGIRALGKGRMIVCMNGKRLLVQFYNRESRHTSHTPGITQALTSGVSTIPPELLAAMSRSVKAEQPTPAPAPGEPSTHTAPVEHTTRQPIPFPRSSKVGHTTGLARELQAALDAYRPGMTYHDLGRALNYSDAMARTVWQELKQRGLLHATGSAAQQEQARPEVPPVPQKSLNQVDLERALRAYDEGNTTVDALAVALGMSSWTVRPLYTTVRKLRKNAG
jgi:hypothetical protein